MNKYNKKLFLKLLFCLLFIVIIKTDFAQLFVLTVSNQTLNIPDSSVTFDLYINTTTASDTLFLASSSFGWTFKNTAFTNPVFSIISGFSQHLKARDTTFGELGELFYTLTTNTPAGNKLSSDISGPDPTSLTQFNQRVARISNRTNYHCIGRFKLKGISNFSDSLTLAWWPAYNAVWGYYTYSPWNTYVLSGTYIAITPNIRLPILLNQFSFNVIQNNIKLQWTTTEEINNSEFDVERKLIKESEWKNVGSVKGCGTINHTQNYIFEDKNLNSGTYNYRLKQIDYNGNFEYFDLKSNVVIGKPGSFNISQNYPNPSNPKTKINYEVAIDAKVSIKIYDIIGREVLTLVDQKQSAGYYSVIFDGTNMASGVYFYRFESGNYTDTKKLVLIK